MGDQEGEKKEEVTKKDEKKGEETTEIVFKVDMHCEACARKVTRSLKGFQGVEEVTTDYKTSKVVVKGNKSVDPVKVCDRVQKKSGRRVDLISPIPKPHEEIKEEKELPKEDKKDEPPPVVATLVLNVQMHCEACAQALKKRIKKIKGVESVTTDLGGNRVTVKGLVDPDKLVGDVYKKTGKHALLVQEEEEKKESDKEAERKGGGDQGRGEGSSDTTAEPEIKKSEYLPPKHYLEYAYPPQIFSDDNPHACAVM